MAVPLTEVGRRGRLSLNISCRGGKTIISDAYCEVPFKITRLQNSDGMAHLILMQSTAGLFGGDRIDCAIHVESGARVLITQQSATKVHPAGGKLAIQNHRIRVDRDAVLHLYYEPLIPFRGSRVAQTTSIDLASGARLYYWESLMAGRIARGEAWQFEELASETRLGVDGKLVYLDRFCLKPQEQSPTAEWKMGPAQYLATALCFDARAVELAGRFHVGIPEAGADTLAPGLTVVRIASVSGPEFHRHHRAFISETQAVSKL